MNCDRWQSLIRWAKSATLGAIQLVERHRLIDRYDQYTQQTVYLCIVQPERRFSLLDGRGKSKGLPIRIHAYIYTNSCDEEFARFLAHITLVIALSSCCKYYAQFSVLIDDIVYHREPECQYLSIVGRSQLPETDSISFSFFSWQIHAYAYRCTGHIHLCVKSLSKYFPLADSI